jgi:hypothetical protein
MYNIQTMSFSAIENTFFNQSVRVTLTNGNSYSMFVYDVLDEDEIVLEMGQLGTNEPNMYEGVSEIAAIELIGDAEKTQLRVMDTTAVATLHKEPSPLRLQVEHDFKYLQQTRPRPELLQSIRIRVGGEQLAFREEVTVSMATDELTYTLLAGDRQQRVQLIDHLLAYKVMVELSKLDFRAVAIDSMAWNVIEKPARNVIDAQIIVTTITGKEYILPTAYFRLGLPIAWPHVMATLDDAFKYYHDGVLFDADVYGAGHMQDELVLLAVEFSDFGKKYNYIADADVYHVGDYVEVPVGADNTPTPALIVDVLYPEADADLPYPLAKTKHVLGKVAQ